MKKAARVFLTLLLCTAAFAQPQRVPVKNVAVIETQIDERSGAASMINRAEVGVITNAIRSEAVNTLPRGRFNVMTTETVQAMGAAVLEECAEENCVIALGSKIGADYIVRAIISKFAENLTVSIEMYETEYGMLVATAPPVRTASLNDLLEKATVACAVMYKKFLETSGVPATLPAVVATMPESKPEPASVAQAPLPTDSVYTTETAPVLTAPTPLREPPRASVYVTGVSSVIGNTLSKAINTALMKTGIYAGMERIDEFVSGTPNDAQLISAGTQAGVSYIFAVNVSGQISVRIIDVKMAAVMAQISLDGQITAVNAAGIAKKIVDFILKSGPQLDAAVLASNQTAAGQQMMPDSEAITHFARAVSMKRVRTPYLLINNQNILNPAFINEGDYMSLWFLFANTLQEFYMQEAGFTMPLGLYNAVGVSWMMQGGKSYKATDSQGQEIGGSIVDQSHFIALTYACNVWGGLTVAGNLNIIAQNVANIDDEYNPKNEMRFGFGADIGLTYKLIHHQRFGNHMLGFSTNNIFNMIMDTDEKYSSALRISLLSDFWEKRVYYAAEFESTTKNMSWEINQKIGFNILRIFNLYMLAGLNPDGRLDHYGFAFGANMPGFFNGRDIEGMMQFVSVGNNEASHIIFYARTEFGKNRNVRHSEKVARSQ